MKASELILQLQRAVAEHGDLPVTVFDGELSPFYFVGCGDVTLQEADRNNQQFGPKFFVVNQSIE